MIEIQPTVNVRRAFTKYTSTYMNKLSTSAAQIHKCTQTHVYQPHFYRDKMCAVRPAMPWQIKKDDTIIVASRISAKF